jgi:hypothetical protein
VIGRDQSSYLYRRETPSFDCLSTERKATIDPERIAAGLEGQLHHRMMRCMEFVRMRLL